MGVRTTNNDKPNLTKTDGHLLEYFRNTFVRGGGGTENKGNLITTGGTKTVVGGNVIHTFTSTGPLEVVSAPPSFAVSYLLVGGGGGGGTVGGGGGGAGGMITGTISVSDDNYTITVGGGGNKGLRPAGGFIAATSGGPSNFSSLTAYGGGRGGDFPTAGSPGGSAGGGGGAYQS